MQRGGGCDIVLRGFVQPSWNSWKTLELGPLLIILGHARETSRSPEETQTPCFNLQCNPPFLEMLSVPLPIESKMTWSDFLHSLPLIPLIAGQNTEKKISQKPG